MPLNLAPWHGEQNAEKRPFPIMTFSGVFGTGFASPTNSPGGAGWMVRFSAGGCELGTNSL